MMRLLEVLFLRSLFNLYFLQARSKAAKQKKSLKSHKKVQSN